MELNRRRSRLVSGLGPVQQPQQYNKFYVRTRGSIHIHRKRPSLNVSNALFTLKMYCRDNVIMSASAVGGAEVQTCHMALKTCQSSRVTPSICFSVHIVSNKCRHKTLPSTYQNVALVGWNYHVVFPTWEMTPFPLPNCSNYENCTCVQLEVVGTWCVSD